MELPLEVLRQELDELRVVVSRLEEKPLRDIDVAYGHLESSHKFKVLKRDGDREKGSWLQLERIFCKSKCGKCPHGDYWFRYTKNKRGKIRITFIGELQFDFDVLESTEKNARKVKPWIGELIEEKDA